MHDKSVSTIVDRVRPQPRPQQCQCHQNTSTSTISFGFLAQQKDRDHKPKHHPAARRPGHVGQCQPQHGQNLLPPAGNRPPRSDATPHRPRESTSRPPAHEEQGQNADEGTSVRACENAGRFQQIRSYPANRSTAAARRIRRRRAGGPCRPGRQP